MTTTAIRADVFLRELALAIARNQVGANVPVHEVLAAEGITQQEYDAIKVNPTFEGYVSAYVKELTETGFSFAAKSRVLAEALLPDVYHMIKDPDVPAAVRLKAVENIVEWGDLKPKKVVEAGGGPGYSITINIPGALPTTVSARAQTADVVDVPTIALPSAPPKKPSLILLDEPESYEYAGDDVIL
ncbi:MAG: hypothetical protein ACKOW0_00895 [Schleiferiaceae bacterium]